MPHSFRLHSVIDTVSSRLPAGHIYYPRLWRRGGKTTLQIVEILRGGDPVKIRLKTLNGLVVYGLVDVMLHFLLYLEHLYVLWILLSHLAIIFTEITLIPSFNNSDLIWKES